MKRVFAFAMSFFIAVCIIGSTRTYAAGCEHYFKRGFESDICTKCGAIRSGINAPFELPFITRENNVVARKAPRQNSAVVNTYKRGTRIKVIARIRNEKNNLWLKLSDGSYIFSDRVAFDFDSMASLAFNSVYQMTLPVCHLDFSRLSIYCHPSKLEILSNMYVYFRPKGAFDLKERNLLGLNSYEYYVYANNTFLNKRYTGESLGNILYGYTCKKVGISSNDAIKFAGLADSSTPIDTFACFFLNDQSRCDDKDDIEMIKFGWNGFVYEVIIL